MHKWNHSKDTGSEQDSNNKVAVNRANYAAKNPELLTNIWGFICKEAEWYLQGFWWQGSHQKISLFLIPMLMMHVFKYATPDNMH